MTFAKYFLFVWFIRSFSFLCKDLILLLFIVYLAKRPKWAILITKAFRVHHCCVDLRTVFTFYKVQIYHDGTSEIYLLFTGFHGSFSVVNCIQCICICSFKRNWETKKIVWGFKCWYCFCCKFPLFNSFLPVVTKFNNVILK